MAYTKLTDVNVAKTIQKLTVAKVTESSPIRQSGLVVTDPRFKIEKGFETTIPFWRRPTGGEATSMGGEDAGVPKALTQSYLSARVLSRATAFSADAIADYASDSDAMQYAISEFSRLRIADEESAMLAMFKGLVSAKNEANADVNMTVNKSITTGTVNATHKFSKDSIVEARRKLGDRGGDLSIIVMHSDLVNSLRAAEPNAFVPHSKTDIGLETYMGFVVIETDNVGIDTTAANPVYTTWFGGRGLFAYAEGNVDIPVELTRDAMVSGFAGRNTVINRYRHMLHPFGFRNKGVPANGVSLTNAELATGTNWTLCVDPKAVPLVAFKTNG